MYSLKFTDLMVNLGKNKSYSVFNSIYSLPPSLSSCWCVFFHLLYILLQWYTIRCYKFWRIWC